MNTQENRRFFKMISVQNSHFGQKYNISDIDEIYPGRRFVSHGKRFEWCLRYNKSGVPRPGITLQTDIPMIHFCDNAIDLLMWYYVGMGLASPWQEIYFFEVKPLSPVHKQRCNDKNKLYQCGAWHVEIVKPMTMGDILRVADQEIQNNTEEIINRYPDKNMLKLIMHIQDNVIRKR